MIPLTQIMEDYRFFKKLFLREFIFDQTRDDLDEVNEVLTYLHNQGMIVGEERNEQAWIEVKGKGRTHLKPFAGLISNYIESYWVVIRGCSYLRKGPMQKKDLIKKIQGIGSKMYRKGEIRRSEALSQANFENALRVYQESDILQLTEKVRPDLCSDRRPIRQGIPAPPPVQIPVTGCRKSAYRML
jgi:glycerol-3-phosphate O-acyltransferase